MKSFPLSFSTPSLLVLSLFLIIVSRNKELCSNDRAVAPSFSLVRFSASSVFLASSVVIIIISSTLVYFFAELARMPTENNNHPSSTIFRMRLRHVYSCVKWICSSTRKKKKIGERQCSVWDRAIDIVLLKRIDNHICSGDVSRRRETKVRIAILLRWIEAIHLSRRCIDSLCLLKHSIEDITSTSIAYRCWSRLNLDSSVGVGSSVDERDPAIFRSLLSHFLTHSNYESRWRTYQFDQRREKTAL